MKAGDVFRCPACGQESIVKVHRKMDGFRCLGEELVCMLCGAVLPEEAPAGKGGAVKSANPLAALLGVEDAAPERLADDSGRGFCRDCKHYISHPFLSRCDLHDRGVNPMDDCPDFCGKGE